MRLISILGYSSLKFSMTILKSFTLKVLWLVFHCSAPDISLCASDAKGSALDAARPPAIAPADFKKSAPTQPPRVSSKHSSLLVTFGHICKRRIYTHREA